jgi:hypothetical protein
MTRQRSRLRVALKFTRLLIWIKASAAGMRERGSRSMD